MATRILLVLVLLCGPFSPAIGQQNFQLKMAETWPKNYPIFGEANRQLAKTVELMSGGRLKIRIDSANKHKAPFGVFDLVRSGRYDMGSSTSYFWKGKVPNTLYFTTMPFGMIAPEQYGWFYQGGGMELMAEVYKPFGLLSFPGGNTGNQMGGWFRKEINSTEDIKGLKMRIPGFAGEVLAQLGAKPVNIPPAELYTSLERGTIDALEWVGPSLDLRMGFHKIAPFYYTGWHEPAGEMQFLINRRSWDKLPEDLREILRVAMRKTAYDTWIRTYHESAVNLEVMRKEHPDIKIRSFPADVIAALKEVNRKLLEEKASADPLARKIIESQQQYQAKSRRWTLISDKAYLDATDPQ